METTKYSRLAFVKQIRKGRYTSYGSYPLYFYTKDCEALCFKCAEENLREILSAMKNGDDKQWEVIGIEINWESTDLNCAHCNDRIESAYAEPEESLEEGDGYEAGI